MNSQLMIMLPVAVTLLVLFIFMAIWATRYVKVGPNRVLIVSGRRYQRADGTSVGFRIVKGGGTFVFPIFEKAEELSLEVISLDLPKSRIRAADGVAVEADGLAQVKIKSDEASILAAAESLLSKSEGEVKNLATAAFEKQLPAVMGTLNAGEIEGNPPACAARVQAAVSADLGKLGMEVVTFVLRRVRVG